MVGTYGSPAWALSRRRDTGSVDTLPESIYHWHPSSPSPPPPPPPRMASVQDRARVMVCGGWCIADGGWAAARAIGTDWHPTQPSPAQPSPLEPAARSRIALDSPPIRIPPLASHHSPLTTGAPSTPRPPSKPISTAAQKWSPTRH
ncbi:hypothetical protein BKA56DRAFT_356745 [Ilyonectria sp. MPI-CAGE-AT-0026]|nr:hypothetical protein BKA56DRAFT_356745 [Ilyonectria sp. MPI-CAGE-AT-0026]